MHASTQNDGAFLAAFEEIAEKRSRRRRRACLHARGARGAVVWVGVVGVVVVVGVWGLPVYLLAGQGVGRGRGWVSGALGASERGGGARTSRVASAARACMRVACGGGWVGGQRVHMLE